MSFLLSSGLRSANPDSVVPQSDLLFRFVAENLSLSNVDIISSWPDEEGWADLSGTATYRPNRLNGLATAEFDGVDDGLDGAGASSESQPNTIFIVGRITGGSGSNYSYFDTHSGGSGRHNFRWGNSVSNYQAFAGSLGSFGGSLNSDFHIFTVMFNNSNTALRIDGTQIGTSNAGSLALDGVALGYVPGEGQFLEGDIAEVVGASASLSSTVISNEEQRLANQYGIGL